MFLILASELDVSFPKFSEMIAEKALGQRVLFVPTAAFGEGFTPDYDRHQGLFANMGMQVEDFDLKDKTIDQTKDALNRADILYMGPGNTFYLLEHAKKSGLMDLISDFVQRGGVYIGSSAGSIIAAPDIAYISLMDEPEKAVLDNTNSFGLVDFDIIPHQDHPEMGQAAKDIYQQYPDAYILNDDQAVIVDGQKIQLV